jgi:hypothetical protein
MTQFNSFSGLYASIGSGVSGALLFNWYDKAQYSAIKYNRSFFSKVNFKKPFHGTFNSISTKIISNGLYFYWIDFYKYYTYQLFNTNETLTHFIAGNGAGITTAIISNPISTVKYRSWDLNLSTYKVINSMYINGGIKCFFKGTFSRICRDVTFSSIYVMSHYYGKQYLGDTPLLFLTDNIAVGLATILSAPFNYSMNHSYAVLPHHPYPSLFDIFKDLRKEVVSKKITTVSLIKRFHIGIGTLRIMLGMTISHRIYNHIYNYFN